MNTREAKKIIQETLTGLGLSNRVTAKTIDFTDLARASCVFVCVHGWEPSPLADEIERTAKAHGFCAEFTRG